VRVVSRVNDVGGQPGFGSITVDGDEPPFHADWEARVYATRLPRYARGHVGEVVDVRGTVFSGPPGGAAQCAGLPRSLRNAGRVSGTRPPQDHHA